MVEGAGQRRVTVVDPREAILGIESSFWREQVREKRFPRDALAVYSPAVADRRTNTSRRSCSIFAISP